MKYASNFLWGAATSSHQIEGDNIHNDWWAWEQQGRVETGEISGRATDHWHRYKEDLDLAQSLGLNSYRFSIEWSRCEPREGQWDENAIDWYRELIQECERRQLLPMVTLHHFTSPLWFTEQGGFLTEESALKFARFVQKVVAALGPRVPLWCTFNEPMVLAVGQYLGGFMPPAKFQPELVAVVSRNMLRAHVYAYQILHGEIRTREGPWKEEPIRVGIANNMVDFMPARVWHPIERGLVRLCRRFFNQSWLDAVTGGAQHFGVPWLIPNGPQVVEALDRRTVDFIGINYYTKAYVRWMPKQAENNFPVAVNFFKTGEVKSDLDWAIHPAGLGRMIRFAKGYGLPIYITENGIADDQDQYRARYLLQHLREIARENQRGADVRGYYYWSLLDNFEWIKGFPPRFGLIKVNYENFQREVRESARVYAEIIAMHQTYFSSPNKILIADLLKQIA